MNMSLGLIFIPPHRSNDLRTASGNPTAVSSKSFKAHAVMVLRKNFYQLHCREVNIMTIWKSLAWRTQVVVLALMLSTNTSWASGNTQEANTKLVRQAFTNWQQGKGTVFDLLAPDAVWTVAGSSPVSGVYDGKTELIEQAVRPISARLATPISPTLESIIAQDDIVVVLWNGTATALDQKPYNNTYLWQLTFKDGRIIQAMAFLDTYALNDLMRRVTPAQ
ncbi:nuclear transport factor 2 family protein [Pseudomonas sp. R1-15]|uniref:nuclear transport factor 2 family protein n=1 Tax=Pseudomonas sp. R1-15 TaxID=2817399 RepID=UPI003DA96B7B